MIQFLRPMLTGCLRTRTRAGIVLLVVLFAVGFAWYSQTRTSPALAHRFVPGQRLVFQLEYLSASAANFTGLTGNATADSDAAQAADANATQAIYTNVEAELQTTVLEVNADGVTAACTLRNPKVQVVVNVELAILQAEAIQADLSRPFLALLDHQGRIRSVYLDPQSRSLSHTFARALLAATQVVLPEPPGQSSWQTREEDPNGEYGAHYQIQTPTGHEPHIAVIAKERTDYSSPAHLVSIRKLDAERVVRPSGQLAIHFDQSAGHVRSVSGEEATTILVNGKVVARAESTLRLNFQREETAPVPDSYQLRRQVAQFRAASEATVMATETAMQQNELGDATLDSLLAELTRLDAEPDANRPETRLYLKVKALIYLHPEACPLLATKLSVAPTQSRTMHLLTGALADVGHAEAQAALVKVIAARRADEAALTMLVPALAMVEMPTVAAEQALHELATQSPYPTIRAGAELGLGSMAHQLADTAPERALRIVRAMAGKLGAAPSVEACRHLLFVLGNAGAGESLDLIAGYLRDPAPETRGAAAAALRWIPSPRVDDLLAGLLSTDADAAVRVEAATALGFRRMTPATFAVQKTAFLKDESTRVRLAALQNLARAQAAFPEARTLLEQAAGDPVKAVREEAESLRGND